MAKAGSAVLSLIRTPSKAPPLTLGSIHWELGLGMTMDTRDLKPDRFFSIRIKI